MLLNKAVHYAWPTRYWSTSVENVLITFWELPTFQQRCLLKQATHPVRSFEKNKKKTKTKHENPEALRDKTIRNL